MTIFKRHFFKLSCYAILCTMFFSLNSCKRELTLNKYVIVIPGEATKTERKAGTELQRYFKTISGSELPIVSDTEAPVEHEISIGLTNRIPQDDIVRFGEDGFVIRTVGKKVAIYGGPRNGALYGVYSLLEEYFDCRKYTRDAEIVPKREKLNFPTEINNEQIPVFTDRYAWIAEWDTTFVDWQKLNQAPNNVKPDWGRLWVHTFDILLPPGEYFAKHPEYFALVKGQRATTQPCLSNPQVLDIVCENLAKEIALNPAAKYWSVSSNDNFGYCECDKCKAVDEAEGSPSGSVIRFVNKVAERFPDKIISTLGYHFTQKAPKTKPAKNVNIMFCSIECERNLPIAENNTPKTAEFRRDMEDWSKLTDNIMVWDYSLTAKAGYMPFPDLFVLQPNMQYFVKNNVKVFFEQSYGPMGGEFWELRSYIIPKLIWNPYQDFNALLNDFLNGYYGAGGKHIREYIDLLHSRMLASGTTMGIFDYTTQYADTWLSADNVREYLTFFDRAEAAVKDNPVFYERVRIARQSLHFTILENSRMYPYGPDGYVQEKDGVWSTKPEWIAMVDEFVDLLKKQGATLVCEWHSPPEDYRQQMHAVAQVQQVGNFAYRKPVTATAQPADKYNPQGQGLPLLTDGLHGSQLHNTQWLGIFEKTFDINIDLESEQTIKHVDAGFMQILWDSAFMPEKVEALTSTDGKNFVSAGIQTHKVEYDPFYGIKIYNFDFALRKARYVKVRVNAMDICPPWHFYAGDDAMVFVDEVVVR